jgi:hypothetical protein
VIKLCCGSEEIELIGQPHLQIQQHQRKPDIAIFTQISEIFAKMLIKVKTLTGKETKGMGMASKLSKFSLVTAHF